MPTDETHENGAAVALGPPVDAAASQDVPAGDINGAAPKSGRRDRSNNKRGGRNNKRKNGGGGGGGEDEDRKLKDREDRPHFATKRRRLNRGDDGQADGTASAPSYMSIQFPAEEIAAEEKRPKRKVAVLLGYAGTGYKGMQINHQEKTIEGDLFRAFVEAGAISKANASDPRKVSLMRCARTDKGVHAASNVVSLKLILGDEKTSEGEGDEGKEEGASSGSAEAALVARINEHLPDQIRIWGILRTNNAFSSHQACDSRWYEYLMPSHVLLPPHPDSFLGKKIAAAAREKGEYDDLKARLGATVDFWEKVEETEIKPKLAQLDSETRAEVLKKLHVIEDSEVQQPDQLGTEEEASAVVDSNLPAPAEGSEAAPVASTEAEPKTDAPEPEADAAPSTCKPGSNGQNAGTGSGYVHTPVEAAIREIKAAYIAAKRRYRVDEERLQQLQKALDCYVGTHNFHNYTILKKFSDSSAKRHIKSFKVNPEPIQIGDTQWLSLKVHGQSFMMHQIRKMVAMAVLLVRSGAPLERIRESYSPKRISIPKAPGLGLLLERPMFDNYSSRAVETLGRKPLNFDKYEKEIQAFKDVHIYKRMWDVEEKSNVFYTFLNQLDNFSTDYFLWVTAHGFDAAYERKEKGERVPKALEAELGDDGENPDEGEG